MKTIWGFSDYEKKYADGITFYSTPSHGGFHLSKERLSKINPAAFEIEIWGRDMAAGWFEEDCNWAFVALAYPEYFSAENVIGAKNTIHAFFPEIAQKLGIQYTEVRP